ncbi:hypothetical protein GBAR_LOCUS12545 [Geodia barretti]|uniref:Uncharacterized protein n=1 Tax=Geodia barretti TaxID=519541 RepID=A0AA35S0A7_GEOBA|nr:hypothetical protein GBAR_LOCUS12545 [Geodia barretti]
MSESNEIPTGLERKKIRLDMDSPDSSSQSSLYSSDLNTSAGHLTHDEEREPDLWPSKMSKLVEFLKMTVFLSRKLGSWRESDQIPIGCHKL